MIISRDHDFGFVHIPKCAGSTVRHQLREIDDLQGAFFGNKTLPDGREINGNHVPLFVLADHYPQALEALRGVTSYAIVRDPMDRFLSAMAQFLRRHVREASEMSKQEILEEARKVIAAVTDDSTPREAKHTIFYPQVEFIRLGGAQVITHVIAMEDIDRLFDRMKTEHGLEMIRDKVWNPTVTYRVPGMSGPLKRAKDIARKYLPMKAYVSLREMAIRAFTTKGVPKLDEVLLASQEVRHFVETFYAEDAVAYRAARQALQQERAGVKKRFGLPRLSGDGLKARSLRGVGMTVLSIGGGNILRLASNLVLTRLLFPEAFGMMALVHVFITGLKMFSDTGIKTSIIRSDRGDDPDFLNTAWTAQILRGIFLWLCTCALAVPVARLYDEPMLAMILPITGLGAIINGLTTTKVATANRHLTLGRVTMIDLGTQAFGAALMIALAWWWGTVWALVVGGLIGSALNTLITHFALPGIRNRLQWDWDVFQELFGFGKFIFLASGVTFLINQGDKLILGAYVSLADLGIYNIGYFLATVPMMLSNAINGKIVFPLFRHKPVAESPENRQKIFRARRLVIACSLAMTAVLAYSGVWLVEIMYDDRYLLAGPIVVLMSLCLVPRLVTASYGSVLLAAGDSRNFFFLNASTAILQTGLMFAGVIWFGVFGVVIAPALAILMTNPLRIYFVRKHQGWDALSDSGFLFLGIAVNGFACWLHWDEIVKLIG